MKKIRNATRSISGASVIMLCTLIGLVVLPLIAMFSFEVARANLGTQQLKNAADAAALAAVATMASQDIGDLANAQQTAKKVALNVFKANSVLGNALNNSVIGSGLNGKPLALEGEIFIEFLNPNTMSPVPDGDPEGKVVRLTASYGMVPAFGQFVGIGKQTIIAASNGAVPQLDVVICFDISGSIDDQTEITMAKRVWNAAQGKTVYRNDGDSTSSPASKTMNRGKIFDMVQAPPTGSPLNAYGLQRISQAGSNTGMTFSETQDQLRSGGVMPEDGQPPGNFSGKSTALGNNVFTDLVVNLDGKTPFAGFTTTDGFSFPDIATLVEASRGNLDDAAKFASSKANTSVSVAPKPGYKAAYVREAIRNLQPIQDAKDAVQLFCQIINNDTDAHFGLVAFDSEVGANEDSTDPQREIDDGVPYGAVVARPIPQIKLNNAVGQSNCNKVLEALGTGINGRPCVAKEGTNIGLAVKTAVDQIKASARINAVKAVILFTDGQPTVGGPLSGDFWQNARLAAVQAKNAGIPVYTIGLATNPAIIPGETAILNASDSNPNTGGIAAISGQGATFHLVTNSKELRAAFQKIARHLVQLVHDQYNEP